MEVVWKQGGRVYIILMMIRAYINKINVSPFIASVNTQSNYKGEHPKTPK